MLLHIHNMTWCELSRRSKLHIHYELSFVGQGITVCSRLEAISLSSPPLPPQFAMVGLDDFDHEKAFFSFPYFFFYFNTCDLKPWRPAGAMGWRALGLLLGANYLYSTSGRQNSPSQCMCVCTHVYMYVCIWKYVFGKKRPSPWKLKKTVEISFLPLNFYC